MDKLELTSYWVCDWRVAWLVGRRRVDPRRCPRSVYVVGQSPQAAVTASLMIVGANSAMGAFMHRSQGTLNWKVALVFGGVGMAAAYLSAGWSKPLPPTVLMISLRC